MIPALIIPLVLAMQAPAQPSYDAQVTDAQKLSVRKAQEHIRDSGIPDLLRNRERPINLTANGPAEDDLRDFDQPSPIPWWFCEPTGGLESPQQLRARLKDCRKRQMLLERSDPRVRIRFRNTGPTPITLQIVGAGNDDIWGRGVVVDPEPVPATKIITITFEVLRRYNRGGRVDILVLTPNATTERNEPTKAFSVTFSDPPVLGLPRDFTSPNRHIQVWLDRTGVASPEFLNPRWPVHIPEPPAQTNPPAELPADFVLEFHSRISDRKLLVTFSKIPIAKRLEFMQRNFRVTKCSETCEMSVLIPEGSVKEMPVELLRSAYVDERQQAPVVSFSVAFFEDSTDLANPTGYLSLVPFESIKATDEEGGWTAKLDGDYGSVPDLSDLKPAEDEDPIITDVPRPDGFLPNRTGANTTRFNGNIRLALEQHLGRYASGEFEIRLKNGVLGEDAPNVKATKYRLNIFSSQGLAASGGRFEVAEPAEAISLSEAGDNVGARYDRLPVGILQFNYLFRKEVPDRRPDALGGDETEVERDHSAALLQFHPRARGPVSGTDYTFYVLYGRRQVARCERFDGDACAAPDPVGGADQPAAPITRVSRNYATVGVDTTLGLRHGLQFTGALFLSRAWTDRLSGAVVRFGDRAHGTVGLFTLAYTNVDKDTAGLSQKTDFTIQGRFGFGTGNKRPVDGSADTTDEGYVGETAGFAPDVLFLNALAPFVKSDRGDIGKGLANKLYAALVATLPGRSPLSLLANASPTGQFDVVSASTTVKVQWYGFNQKFDGHRHAGLETDLEFALETPEGVKYLLTAAGFWPGAALVRGRLTNGALPERAGLITRPQWALFGKVTVKLH